MTCDAVLKQLPFVLYGELSFDEEELLHEHLDSCAACRSELEQVRSLHRQLDNAHPDVPSQLLQDCRRSLRVAVAAEQERPRLPRLAWLRSLWASPAVWRVAAAAALVIAGFYAGRTTGAQINGPVASRVRYVQPDGSGNVQIVFEEVRQKVLEGRVDDNQIRGLLVSAAREANDPGVRVETMNLLKNRLGSMDVRRVLLAALQHDTNPGVRLKALEALRGQGQDAETRRVLAQVLLTDENPGVRTQAIDILTEKSEPALVGVLQELVAREDNNYVRMKCQRALSEMNASVESF